ncbi:DUF5518 domain-containing protein [Halorussus amylolyticus]|uniref:DUF5518 domain-containing protein n=1 Tax=Halorussus amylolyticus TaxID=1126242 RepID=UPI0010532CA4|nr:DUF5518 domain-containing protein [Halorussus amylolyticus]
MSREQTLSRERTRSSTRDQPNTFVNALVGAVVTVVTAPLLPFAAIIGGGVAGFLQRGDLAEGAKVGAFAGAVASIPAALVAWLVVGFFGLGLGLDPLFGLSIVFAGLLLLVVAGYLVGAGALGGALGAYLRQEI